MKLLIVIVNEDVREYYENKVNQPHTFEGDSGFDFITPNETVFTGTDNKMSTPHIDPTAKFIDLGIKCAMYNKYGENVSWMLYPRSSISETPLMLANSIGLIDATYRGNVIMALRNLSVHDYKIEKGHRLVQAVSPSLEPFTSVKIVTKLNETNRGKNGFGSTGK
jgi:dUTP pyrophosphatase